MLISCLGGLGCLDPTQMTIELDSDAPCVAGISVARRGEAELSPPVAVADRCSGTLVVFPSGETNAPIDIRVVGALGVPLEECGPPDYAPMTPGGGCVVARRAIRFIEQTPLRLPISLSASCVGVPCSPATTCVDGRCVDSFVRAEKCTLDVCDAATLEPCEVPIECPGDANGDGVIDLADGPVIDAGMGVCGDPGFEPAADFNGDGRVDELDALISAGNLQCSCADVCDCQHAHACPGDINRDGVVDDADFALWDGAKFTQCGVDAGYLPTADFNDDGLVDGVDFSVWQSNRGPCP